MRAAILLLAALTACPSGDDDDDDTPFSCALGLWQEDGAWVPADGGEAELVLGIQGFLWFSLQLETDLGGPEYSNLTFDVQVGKLEGVGGSLPNVALDPDGSQRRSGELHVRLDNEEGTLPFVDQPAHLTIWARSGLRECLAEVDLVLRDLDPCLHSPDGPVCPDEEK